MSTRSSWTTLPSEAEVTDDLATAVPELSGFVGALIAFDSKKSDGYHWYLMPGQLAIEEDDDPVHVLLSESEVSLLMFKDEKDLPIGAPFVSSALALTRSRGLQTLERSALLTTSCSSERDDAAEGDDGLGGIPGASPSSTARAAATASGVAARPKAPVNLFGPPASGTKQLPAQAAGTSPMAAPLTKIGGLLL